MNASKIATVKDALAAIEANSEILVKPMLSQVIGYMRITKEQACNLFGVFNGSVSLFALGIVCDDKSSPDILYLKPMITPEVNGE